MAINKTQIIGLLLMIILSVVVWKVVGKNQNNNNDQEKIVQTDGMTTIKLSAARNGMYSPQQVRVKLGTKIRIEGDPESLSGSMDTIIVDGYEVSKKIILGDNVLEFVASNPGEFKMHCANGMGNGTLIVE